MYREACWKRPCWGLERRVNRLAPSCSRTLLDVSKLGSEAGYSERLPGKMISR